MAGGIGSRFWPLSTPEFPKQFIDILGCGRTLIQLTVDRFEGVCPMQNFWVVTNAAYVDIVRQQLPGIPASHILAEPAARNTAPCIAWACWSIRQEDPTANVVVTPADAVVMNPVEFRRVIANALAFTDSHNSIVTIGIKPSRPTELGMVRPPIKPLQSRKAECPIEVKLLGKVIKFSKVQSLKALAGMVVNPVKYCNSWNTMISVLPWNQLPKFVTAAASE